MRIEGRRVLVTGAGGFIGSHLAEALVLQGCSVRAMIHYNSRGDRGNLDFLPRQVLAEIEVVSGDVADLSFMRKAADKCETVFHLAALIAIPYSYISPASYVSTNVMGTLNTLQACLDRGVERLVHTSTSECYGTARYEPIDEAHPVQGQSPYSASKISADKFAEAFHLSFGLPVAIVRPFNTYGPRQSARAVIPTIFSQLLAGCERVRLGALSPERDFNFVTDTVSGFILASEVDAAVGEVINIGSGKKISIGGLAEIAMQITGKEVPIVAEDERVRPENSEVGVLRCDPGKAERILAWKPAVGLVEGLSRVSDFITEHPELYRPEEYAR
jgi:NAD dependent epimerase/dehydratase